MRVDSLDELQAAFAAWRSQKKHARESMPEELVARAHRAAKKHGETAVVRVTRVERGRLFRHPPTGRTTQVQRRRAEAKPRPVPAFTRVELGAPCAPPSPRLIAEVETGSGVTLRVFEPTPELVGLLSAVCGLGGVR